MPFPAAGRYPTSPNPASSPAMSTRHGNLTSGAASGASPSPRARSIFASEEARRDVTTSILAQVAQDYFQLLALDRQLAIAQSATNSFGESLKLFTERLQGGVASKLETSSAEALLGSAAATIPDLRAADRGGGEPAQPAARREPRPDRACRIQFRPAMAPGRARGAAFVAAGAAARHPRSGAAIAFGQRPGRRGRGRLLSAVGPHRPASAESSPELSMLTAGSATAWARGRRPDRSALSRRATDGAISPGQGHARPIRAAIPGHRAQRIPGGIQRPDLA